MRTPRLPGWFPRPRGRRAAVTSVTDAPEGLSTEMRGRQTQYLVMMGIRILCLPLVILVDGWLRWVFIICAVVLPYVAVLLANATRRGHSPGPERVELPHMYALPSAQQPVHADSTAVKNPPNDRFGSSSTFR